VVDPDFEPRGGKFSFVLLALSTFLSYVISPFLPKIREAGAPRFATVHLPMNSHAAIKGTYNQPLALVRLFHTVL